VKIITAVYSLFKENIIQIGYMDKKTTCTITLSFKEGHILSKADVDIFICAQFKNVFREGIGSFFEI